jgi:CRP-like cAMP-binding protein
VCSGLEGFFVELSSFNYFGVDALLNDNYIPDFSAQAIEKTRLLRVKRLDFRKAISNIKNFNR